MSDLPFISKARQLGHSQSYAEDLERRIKKALSSKEIRFGFTKDREHYTHSTDRLDADGKPIWVVLPIPHEWKRFKRPVKYYGEDGYLTIPQHDTVAFDLFKGSISRPQQLFYPLRVLHGLKA